MREHHDGPNNNQNCEHLSLGLRNIIDSNFECILKIFRVIKRIKPLAHEQNKQNIVKRHYDSHNVEWIL